MPGPPYIRHWLNVETTRHSYLCTAGKLQEIINVSTHRVVASRTRQRASNASFLRSPGRVLEWWVKNRWRHWLGSVLWHWCLDERMDIWPVKTREKTLKGDILTHRSIRLNVNVVLSNISFLRLFSLQYLICRRVA